MVLLLEMNLGDEFHLPVVLVYTEQGFVSFQYGKYYTAFFSALEFFSNQMFHEQFLYFYI